MQIKITYKGILNGKYCISCGHIEQDMTIEEEVPVYHPNADKIFKKNDKYYDIVILKENENIEDYQEVDKPNDY